MITLVIIARVRMYACEASRDCRARRPAPEPHQHQPSS